LTSVSLLFLTPTGLAAGLALKELRYAVPRRRFAPWALQAQVVPPRPVLRRGFGG